MNQYRRMLLIGFPASAAVACQTTPSTQVRSQTENEGPRLESGNAAELSTDATLATVLACAGFHTTPGLLSLERRARQPLGLRSGEDIATKALQLHRTHQFEEVWTLAWVLGFSHPPLWEDRPVRSRLVRELEHFFGPPGVTERTLARDDRRRSEAEVRLVERILILVENSVAGAQFTGSKTGIPKTYSVAEGLALVRRRRQPLTWALVPGIGWDEATHLSA